jgi:ATP-dependent DNA ligase
MNFPKLIKENRFWEIVVDIKNMNIFKYTIYTIYGTIGGKITKTVPQKFEKSKGMSYIKKKITDKIRNGYRPETGEIQNKQIKDFIKPMSAILLEGNEDKIIFPAFVQPKLDGFRGISIKSEDIIIVSRNGLPYPHLEKIKLELKMLFNLFPLENKLDGELYLHGKPLGHLRSVLGRKELNKSTLEIEKNIKYYIFDYQSTEPFDVRFKTLQTLFKHFKSDIIKLVNTVEVHSLKEIKTLENKYIQEGYEGTIVRNKKGIYQSGKKSQNVFRSKEFKTKLFKIVGANEGKGNEKGTVIWKLKCGHKTFTAKPTGTKEERQKLYKNRHKYIGLQIPIKYYKINSDGCVSRHPIALSNINNIAKIYRRYI